MSCSYYSAQERGPARPVLLRRGRVRGVHQGPARDPEHSPEPRPHGGQRSATAVLMELGPSVETNAHC